jgi:hypothetical protein
MSDNTLDFERKEFRSVIKYLFVKGLSGKEIFADMISALHMPLLKTDLRQLDAVN